MSNEAPVRCWTAKRKSAVVIDNFKGKTTPVKVARQHDFTVAEVERWVEEAERNMEHGFRTRPKDLREQYEKKLQEIREALGDAHLQIYALNGIGACSTTRRTREVAAGGAPSQRSLCLAQ
ncbi:transposase [Spiribacter sp. SSL99]|uniref:transposase n=1 Tax=Spiribacter sp. SSL99 TaxID=1866884 RepID=UPI00190FA6F9|nr:transposase [Spiribacter sp. SSL99]